MNEENKIQVMEKRELPEFITSIDEAKNRYNMLKMFVKSVMKEGSDYGVIPGTDKPTLLKPGAEKLNNIYGLYSEVDILEKIEEWDKPFFNYIVKATIYNKRTGIKESEGIGSCNSMESKYRFRWVFESDIPEEQKENKDNLKTKKFFSKKKNREYKMFRIVNDDIFSLVNTLQKMASKRAYIDATLKATRTSEMFTQDLEDIRDIEIEEEKEIKRTKNDILNSIKAIQETLGMTNKSLNDYVRQEYEVDNVTKLDITKLEEVEKYLDNQLAEKVQNFEQQEIV